MFICLIATSNRFANILMALARPLFISTPLCPPLPQFTSTSYATYPAGMAIRRYGSRATCMCAPAEPTVISSYASESRFSTLLPFMKSSGRFAAPLMSSSSQVVVRTSSAGCFKLSSSSMASAIASPMPLSAPSEVWLARIHCSPFSSYSIGVTLPGMSYPASATQTISMWFSMTSGSQSSYPGEAAFLITTQLFAERLWLKPRRSANLQR